MNVVLLIFCLAVSVCDAGRSCLSCADVEGSGNCSHHITCADHEVCYIHKYSTESGRRNYDFGCSLPQVCPTSVGAFVGKRSEGHHSVCYHCCNDTDICNKYLQCDDTTPQTTVTSFPEECSDITPKISTSGVYTIYPFHERPVLAHCILDGSLIWTVIQQRNNGSVNFYRDWDSYKQGFGSPYGEYWLGNDIIHVLTSSYHHELMIKMSDFEGTEKYAEYSTFHIGDEANAYSLFVSGYHGNAGDAFASYHSGSKFTTYDRDNDEADTNCASGYTSAWWFKSCHDSDLNGEFLYGHHTHAGHGVVWNSFRVNTYSLKTTIMMIRKISI